MNQSPAENIVEFLSFSASGPEHAHLRDLTPRHWKRTAQWLDDSGLAFYFLQRLKGRNAQSLVPEPAVAQLERNFRLNQQRTEGLLQRFDGINAGFRDAGVPFAVLKGFSLVPEFCQHSALRHQGDFDYLVDETSLSAARELLLALGYTEKTSRSTQEYIFLSPGASAPSRSGRQYSPEAPHAVELHLDVWDAHLYRLPAVPRLFSPERTSIFKHQGIVFPALHDEDAFLLQVLHACHHLFTHWIRMSCLFEIGYFLHRQASDSALWSRVEQRIGPNIPLREFVVIVTDMAEKLFACPIPCQVRAWGESLRPGARLWLERYARTWAFSNLPVYDLSLFPASRLVLFLHQQYPCDGYREAQQTQKTSGSASRPFRMLSAIRREPALLLKAQWWKQQLLLRRTLFHALARLRYACEIPRWQRLMRRRSSRDLPHSANIAPISQSAGRQVRQL